MEKGTRQLLKKDESLRELEDDDLIKRFEYLEIPVRVEYALTEKAVRLQPILLELIQWEIATRNQHQRYKNFFSAHTIRVFV